MSNIIEQSFSLNIRIMDILGIYPSKSHPKLQLLKGFILYFTMLPLTISLVILKIAKEENSDNIQNNFMMSYLAETIAFSFKLLPFMIYGNEMKKCIHYFGEPQFFPKSQEEKEMMDHCVLVCKIMSKVFFWFLLFAEICWILPAYMNHRQPLDAWLPYDDTHAVVFYPTFIYLGAASTYGAFCGCLVDPLIGGLAYHATTQIKILKHNLQNLEKNIKNKRSPKVTLEDVNHQLQKSVIHHNLIFDFLLQYESCFSFSLFSQIAGCIFGVCFCCIGCVLSTTFFSKVKNATYGLIFSNQIFFYCYFGTLLFEESEYFISGIFMGNWYNYDVKIRKILILMMERSKRPIILRAGKILDLTLQTFTSVLKTSYSMIAVLNNY